MIRNFSIIAHIDHGKSTLADRLIEFCGGLDSRGLDEQVLDSMELERERGITIKAQTVALNYFSPDQKKYLLNLIDTPGHVDFSYEVSRSLAASEGAILLIDATQGVQAQTLATCYSAIDLGLEVIPVLNKVDLDSAEPERVRKEIEDLIGIDTKEILSVSAKTGSGIDLLFEQIIKKIPPPEGEVDEPLKALIIDSWFDNYVGVVMLVRIFQGSLKLKEKIKLMHGSRNYLCERLGIFTPKAKDKDCLSAGEVGYIIAGIKELDTARVGDTITLVEKPALTALTGFKQSKPQVYAGLYPVESQDFDTLKMALNKLRLNDSSLVFESENSQALGSGFRCGFLGLLHLEIIQERLEREFGANLITSAPSVVYKIRKKSGEIVDVENPSKLPDPSKITEFLEPIANVNIVVPEKYLGSVLKLCNERRGIQNKMNYSQRQVLLNYDLPMNEIMTDFFDKLKSISKGYASLDYEFKEFKPANLVKLDVLLNGEKIDALSSIVHQSSAREKGKSLVQKMRELIPRQMFDISVQAAIGSQIVARENIKALRKNVLAKCYGGDVTRKRKLLEKQKEGKKRMKKIGKINIPQSAFLAMLKE